MFFFLNIILKLSFFIILTFKLFFLLKKNVILFRIKKFKFKNSMNIIFFFTLQDNLKKEPLPLPILEFLDFFETGELPCKKIHKLLFKIFFLKVKKNFNFFFNSNKYMYSILYSFKNFKPILPYLSLL